MTAPDAHPAIELHRDHYPGRPVYDTAVSHALLRAVAKGTKPESLRLYVPEPALLFSNLDARLPGYPRALEIARDAGFEPVTRLAGGHAAAFLEASIAFAWATPDPDAHLHIERRFDRLTAWMVEALRALGLDARVGEVPGEYCPGEHSVNLEGRVKVLGVGQRVIRGAAHVGGVLTVGQTTQLREVLIPIYEALELEFEPNTAGGVADADASLTPERVIDAIVGAVEADGLICRAARFGASIESAAEGLVDFHTPSANRKTTGLRAVGGKALVQSPANSPAHSAAKDST